MANDEQIRCDYAGCQELFAYRIKGFNLCAEHCFEPGEFTAMAQDIAVALEKMADRKQEDGR